MENEINIQLVFWAGSALMILAVISIILIVTLYHRHRSIQKRHEAERLLNTAIKSKNKERLRIARDLHDDISGDLNAIANYLITIKKLTPDAQTKALADEVAKFTRNTLKNVQLISYNLIPPQLEASGLIPAIEDYLDRIRKWEHITIDIIRSSDKIPIAPAFKYEVFRIIQELTSNMLRHGKVSAFTFQIIINDKTTSIIITDNGIPFDFYKSYHKASGLGLKNIMSRIRVINAQLEHQTSPKGNTTTVHIPNQNK